MIRVRTHVLLVVCLIWGAIPALMLGAPVPSDADKPKAESSSEKTRKALDQTRDVDIEEKALPQALQELKDLTKINFVLDTTTLVNFVGDPNGMMVTMKQKNAKLRSALRTMLNQHHLSYAIIGETVVVTTEEMALQRQLHQRVSLDLDGVGLSDALKHLARETATNVMVDAKIKKEAETAITLQLDDVPLETAVRLLSEMAGLKPVRLGNVLYVTSKANANELRNEPDLIGGQPGVIVPQNPGYGPPTVPVPVPGVTPPAPGVTAPPPPAVVPDVPAPPKPDKDDKPKDDKPKDDKPKDK